LMFISFECNFMSHQEFDEQIRQSLEGMTPQIEPNFSWERLAERLDQQHTSSEDEPESDTTTSTEELFDQNIREKIQQVNTPSFEYRNWLLLSERLEEQDARTAWLYRHKFAEISILTLLLLTIINVLSIPVAKLEAMAAPILQLTHTASQEDKTEQQQARANAFATINIMPALTVLYSPEERTSNAAHTPITHARRVPLNAVKKLESKIPIVAIPENQTKSARIEIASLLPQRILSIKHIAEDNKSNPYYLYAPQKDKSSYWSLGIVAVMNLNQIYTPKDNFFGREIEAYTKYNLGGGGGFTLSRETAKSAWETGLIYLSKKYQPTALSIERSNSRGVQYKETLKSVQINLLEIPFTYRYKFIRKEKIDYFASLGGTLNLITQANYDNNTSYYAPAFALTVLDANQQPSEIKQAKKFNDGLFEGGTIQENIYVTAQAALGLEYKITPRFSFFNQATYQRHLTLEGIGANKNSFHAYSIFMGLKTKF
jgi:hypothetical protein